jgi:hypothetical protein
MKQRLPALLALLAALTAVAPCVLAGSEALAAGNPVVSDCNAHGRLAGSYSVGELRNALSTMHADVKEYTDCYDVIQRALLAAVGGLHAGGGGGLFGGSFLPTWLVVLLVLLGLSAATFGAVAVRRRRQP